MQPLTHLWRLPLWSKHLLVTLYLSKATLRNLVCNTCAFEEHSFVLAFQTHDLLTMQNKSFHSSCFKNILLLWYQLKSSKSKPSLTWDPRQTPFSYNSKQLIILFCLSQDKTIECNKGGYPMVFLASTWLYTDMYICILNVCTTHMYYTTCHIYNTEMGEKE